MKNAYKGLFFLLINILLLDIAVSVPLEEYNQTTPPDSLGGRPYIYTGQVLEVQDVGTYTFFLFTPKGEPTVKKWAATTQVSLKKGYRVTFSNPLVMKNFYSKTLKKTFKNILFLSEVGIKSKSSL